MKIKVGDYVRTKKGYIAKYKGIEKHNNLDGESEDWFIFDSTIIDDYEDKVPVGINKSYFIKSSPDILELIEPWDLLYIDIEYGFAGGLVVPRIYETQAELDEAIEKIKNDDEREIVGIVTHEQLENMMYEVKNNV